MTTPPPVPNFTQEDWDALTEGERLGLLVGHAYGTALAERDEASAQAARWRDLHEAALDDLVQARRLLEQAHKHLGDTSWAADEQLADSIQAFLGGTPVDSDQTPTQED